MVIRNITEEKLLRNTTQVLNVSFSDDPALLARRISEALAMWVRAGFPYRQGLHVDHVFAIQTAFSA